MDSKNEELILGTEKEWGWKANSVEGIPTLCTIFEFWDI